MPPAHDIYLSHSRYDVRSARALGRALAARGVRARFRDHDEDACGAPSAGCNEPLLTSKAVVCLYSADYGRYRDCQQELVAAVTAARAHGDRTGRVLVVVTEKDDAHVVPAELRARTFAHTPEPIDSRTIDELAGHIAKHVAGLAGIIGCRAHEQRPSWIGRTGGGVESFVGRAPELWAIHERLMARDRKHRDSPTMASVQIVGPAGIGKSSLAEEYALRFGAVHGTVVWLSAEAAAATDAAGVLGDTVRIFQRSAVARALGVDTNGLGSEALERALAEAVANEGPHLLWIVDGLPAGIDGQAARAWLPPCPAATLITTRRAEHVELGEAYEIGPLAEVDAYELLTGGVDPTVEAEEMAAWTMVEDLGGHPLALEVAGAAAAALRPDSPLVAFRARIANPRRDLLEFSRGLADEVPRESTAAISGTLWHAFRALGPEALDCLRLALLLAPAHVPEDVGVCALAQADGLGRDAAWERFLAGVAELAGTALVEPTGSNAPGFGVHPLIRRVFSFYDHASHDERRAVMQQAVAAALDETVPPGASASEAESARPPTETEDSRQPGRVTSPST